MTDKGSPDYLFSSIPSLQVVEEWLQKLKIRQGIIFTENNFSWDIFNEVLIEVEPYYYPCKARQYLYKNHSISSAINVLRQLVKPHGLNIKTHERVMNKKKYYEYFLTPDLTVLPDKPATNIISFD